MACAGTRREWERVARSAAALDAQRRSRRTRDREEAGGRGARHRNEPAKEEGGGGAGRLDARCGNARRRPCRGAATATPGGNADGPVAGPDAWTQGVRRQRRQGRACACTRRRVGVRRGSPGAGRPAATRQNGDAGVERAGRMAGHQACDCPDRRPARPTPGMPLRNASR